MNYGFKKKLPTCQTLLALGFIESLYVQMKLLSFVVCCLFYLFFSCSLRKANASHL